ncbi:MAG: hypothetical protein ACPKM0_08965 [Pleomorphochaeta sp.]
MKRKLIALLLIIMLSSSSVFCDSVEFDDYEAYTIDEFPEWSWKLRRGESLFFGSLAITLPLTIVAYNAITSTSWVDSPSDDDFTNFTYQLSIAAILSLSIAVGDYIIGELE